MKYAIPATPHRSNGMRSLEAECSTSVQQRAAAVDEQHRRSAIEDRRAFRTGGIQNCWRSELGAQLGRESQPACLCVYDVDVLGLSANEQVGYYLHNAS